MNQPDTHQPDSAQATLRNGISERLDAGPESTLRMIARSAPPAGLQERIHERIEAALRAEMRAGLRLQIPKARILAWPSFPGSGTVLFAGGALRMAAAAAIVAVVVGGGWGIASRVQPASSARGVVAPVRAVGPGGFSSAGAMRTPQTFNGPVIAPVDKAQSSNRNEAKTLSIRKAKSATLPAQNDGLTKNQADGQTK
jgi:hypothetical protein